MTDQTIEALFKQTLLRVAGLFLFTGAMLLLACCIFTALHSWLFTVVFASVCVGVWLSLIWGYQGERL